MPQDDNLPNGLDLLRQDPNHIYGSLVFPTPPTNPPSDNDIIAAYKLASMAVRAQCKRFLTFCDSKLIKHTDQSSGPGTPNHVTPPAVAACIRYATRVQLHSLEADAARALFDFIVFIKELTYPMLMLSLVVSTCS